MHKKKLTIEKINDDTEDAWEGCLSIPGMLGLVRRYSKIKYSGFNLEGKKIVKEVEGLHARVVQHEFDHLNGILYTKRLVHKDAFGFENEMIGLMNISEVTINGNVFIYS